MLLLAKRALLLRRRRLGRRLCAYLLNQGFGSGFGSLAAVAVGRFGAWAARAVGHGSAEAACRSVEARALLEHLAAPIPPVGVPQAAGRADLTELTERGVSEDRHEIDGDCGLLLLLVRASDDGEKDVDDDKKDEEDECDVQQRPDYLIRTMELEEIYISQDDEEQRHVGRAEVSPVVHLGARSQMEGDGERVDQDEEDDEEVDELRGRPTEGPKQRRHVGYPRQKVEHLWGEGEGTGTGAVVSACMQGVEHPPESGATRAPW